MADSKNKYLYLMSEVDVPTGEKPEKGEPRPTKRVGPGIVANLDLTQAQIDKLPRGVVRKATADEIQAAEEGTGATDDAGSRAEIEALKAEQEREMAALQGKLSAERSEAEAGGKLRTDAQRTKFDAAQQKQIDTLTEKHRKALDKLGANG